MNTWTPIFSKIVDSSLWAEPDGVVKVFLTLLALKDADQVVRHNAYAIGRKCWPSDVNAEKRVLEALKVLASPDRRRLEPQPHEGRRIEKTEEGWLLLNGQFYKDMMRKINRREYQRQKQAVYRERKKKGTSSGGAGAEMAYVRAEGAGASQEQLDRIVAESLPEKAGPAGEGQPGDQGAGVVTPDGTSAAERS